MAIHPMLKTNCRRYPSIFQPSRHPIIISDNIQITFASRHLVKMLCE